jgi:hypothetical protein
MVKESLDFVREIWSYNPDKAAYNQVFDDVMDTIKAAIYYQGYIGANFPLSFENDVDVREVPNYLIVNELKEQVITKSKDVKKLQDSVAILEGQIGFMQRQTTMQQERYINLKKHVMKLNQQCIDLTTKLAQKDSSFETKLKELKKLQFDNESMKQLAFDREQETKTRFAEEKEEKEKL